ncbi:MAG: glycosyltransferase family 2 protein [Deltaproteobacteria bacterium]
MGLSAVVITKNEEKNIARCLESLSFCDEIIVVDSHSTDNTLAIARKFTPKVFEREWSGYVEQKNYAVGLTSNDWVLSIDADEEVSSELRQELQDVLKSTPQETAYLIARKTIHSGQWIKYGGWYPNRLVRLFRKSFGSWQGGPVHEFWATQGRVGELKNDLVHYSFDSLSDQVERNNLYSSLGAKLLLEQKHKFSLFRLLFKPGSKFVETYFLKLGFLDGYRGFFISISAAYSVFLKWAKLWELNQDGQES